MASATSCKSPNFPTLEGPYLNWMSAEISLNPDCSHSAKEDGSYENQAYSTADPGDKGNYEFWNFYSHKSHLSTSLVQPSMLPN